MSSALTMLTSLNLWAPGATTVMTSPALLLITAGEKKMQAMGGFFKAKSYFSVSVLLYTAGVSGHHTVNANKRRGHSLLSRNINFLCGLIQFFSSVSYAGSICRWC